jgi:hypothetical protein
MAYLAQIEIIRKGERYREIRPFDKKRLIGAWISNRSQEIRALIAHGNGQPPKMKGRRLPHPRWQK